MPVSYTHLRAHETSLHLVCRLLLEKKKFLPKTLHPSRKTKIDCVGRESTRINCLEGSYADHYTTDAPFELTKMLQFKLNLDQAAILPIFCYLFSLQDS